METNSIPSLENPENIIDFGWLLQLPPESLVFLFPLIIGYAIRRMPFANNKWAMWLAVPVAIISYFFLANSIPGKPDSYNIVHRLIVGSMLGVGGTVIAMAAHDKLLTALAKKLPWLSFLVDLDEPAKPTTQNPT